MFFGDGEGPFFRGEKIVIGAEGRVGAAQGAVTARKAGFGEGGAAGRRVRAMGGGITGDMEAA
jgi:hypothetical protein